jgi:hypothetical protein
VITESPTGIPIGDCRLIDLPRVPDQRGNLTFIEGGKHVPFEIARVYWIYDVPGGEKRGGHAYRILDEFLIALSGSFDVILDDGSQHHTVQLNRPGSGLFVSRMTWRHLENFTTNAVCLILASTEYDERDYIRDYRQYQQSRNG